MHATPNRKLLLSTFLASLIALAFFAVPADAARSFNTGVVDADAFHTLDDVAFDRVQASGAKYIKNNLYWTYLLENGEASKRPGTESQPFDPTDPASPYYRTWGAYDIMVRKASARGLEMIFSVVAPPRWARVKACAGSGICTPNPSDYADFATAAARRYDGTFNPGDGQGVLPRVKFWQAWVEPNLDLFYKPVFNKNGSPAAPYTFRVILNRFYDAIHAVSDDNFVIAGGLAPNEVPKRAIAPLAFTRMALCMAGNFRNPRPKAGCNFRVKADAWSVHPYTTGSPIRLPSKPDNMSIAALPRMNKLLRAATNSNRLTSKFGRTQLWVTEFSWDSRPPDPGGVASALLSRWVAQAMHMMYKANVQTMIWFGLRDHARTAKQPWPESFESGLYLRGKTIAKDRPKPVLRAFRFPFYAQLSGKQGFAYWGRTPNNKTAVVDLFGRRGAKGSFVRVGSVKANANGIFTGSVRKRGFTKNGAVYAKLRGAQASIAFGLWKTADCRQPPFGGTKFNASCLKRR